MPGRLLVKRRKGQYYGICLNQSNAFAMPHAALNPMQPYFKSRGYVPGGIVTNSQNVEFHMERLPPFLRTLLVADGTVTKSLEAFFWEQVAVENLGQSLIPLAQDVPALDLPAGATVLERRVRLLGMESDRAFAQAHSLIKLEALPLHLREDLQLGRIGIGELLRERGLETYREILDVGQSASIDDAIYRTYRILIQHQPAILITETFPCAIYRS